MQSKQTVSLTLAASLVQTVNIAAKLTCLLLTHNETEDHRLYLTRLLEQLLYTFYFNCFSIP